MPTPSRMLRSSILSLLLTGGVVWAQQDAQHRGVHPRATADDYVAKAAGPNETYAASLIPVDQAKHLFAFDISGTYLVFEVACFPNADRTSQIDTDDFVVKLPKGAFTHQSEAATVAGDIQRQNTPRRNTGNTDVVTEASIGYSSGTDPYTGRRVSGVSTGAGVGVQHGGDHPPYADPAGVYVDRDLLQSQLQARALPSGKFDHPVAGYLYFLKSQVKKDASGNIVLEHMGDTGAPHADLTIPAKSR